MTDSCLNCGSSFTAEQRFCGACGQRTNVSPRLTMRDIGWDLAHAITHADHSVFALIRGLVTRPGHVADDYVRGRRKRHFGPFAFLMIAVGLASAVILISGVEWFSPFHHRHSGEFLQRHVNLIILLQAPVLAAFCALFFRADERSFADHLVLAAYATGCRALFIALVETPLWASTHVNTANPWLAFGYFGIWFAYFAFAAAQFYAGNRSWSAARGALAALLSQALTIALIMAILYLTTRFGAVPG
jgi:hypothetical protein